MIFDLVHICCSLLFPRPVPFVSKIGAASYILFLAKNALLRRLLGCRTNYFAFKNPIWKTTLIRLNEIFRLHKKCYPTHHSPQDRQLHNNGFLLAGSPTSTGSWHRAASGACTSAPGPWVYPLPAPSTRVSPTLRDLFNA